VRTMEIAVAINRGRHGDLDRPLIRTLARDLGRDVDRFGQYARARNHEPEGVTALRYAILSLTLDQARERYLAITLIRYLATAARIARQFLGGVTLAHAHGLIVGLSADLGRALDLTDQVNRETDQARWRVLDRSLSRTLDLAIERARALDRLCGQGVTGRLGIAPAKGLAEAILDGAMDDFTSADLTHAILTDPSLTDPSLTDARLTDSYLIGVRWSLSGTIWPPGTDVTALLARSHELDPGSGVLVVKRRGRYLRNNQQFRSIMPSVGSRAEQSPGTTGSRGEASWGRFCRWGHGYAIRRCGAGLCCSSWYLSLFRR